MPIDRESFWNKKILQWENGRYRMSDGTDQGILERLADMASASLRFRIKSALALLRPHVEGKHVLEVGCGSGLLTQALMEAGAASFTGIDIASEAIDAARQRNLAFPWSDRVDFQVGDIRSTPSRHFDLVISLGLLDWLTDDELRDLFELGSGGDFFHAIAEKRNDPRQWLHRLYVHIAYGHRSEGYVPRYYSALEIKALAGAFGFPEVHFFRDPRLSFGAIAASFPMADLPRDF